MGEPVSLPDEAPSIDLDSAQMRIVIGENNEDLAITLSLLLEAEPDMRCCAIVACGSDVLQAVDQHAPNAFILDLSLDDGPSLPLITQLRSRLPQAAIIVFTGHRNPLLNAQCVAAGADAVVVKSGDIEELTQALRRAAAPRTRGAQIAAN